MVYNVKKLKNLRMEFTITNELTKKLFNSIITVDISTFQGLGYSNRESVRLEITHLNAIKLELINQNICLPTRSIILYINNMFGGINA